MVREVGGFLTLRFLRPQLILLCAFLLYAINSSAAVDDFVGNGSDGPFASTGANSFVADMGGAYASITANHAIGSSTITVTAGGASFLNCDAVLIMNMTTGEYERLSVHPSTASLGTVVTLIKATTIAFDGTTDNVQLIRCPEFSTATISVGHSLTTAAFDGSTGGVIWFYANGTVTIAGTIDVDGLGWSGGAAGALGALGAGFAGGLTPDVNANDGSNGGDGVGGAGGGDVFCT
ncbi:MAG: hypothetical protein ACJAZ2_000565 [Glaciecola sp.]|jgi:hypothetical protein